jgi:hypothetical protein
VNQSLKSIAIFIVSLTAADSDNVIPPNGDAGMILTYFATSPATLIQQVFVIRKSGEKRALSSILQNAFDAGLTYLRQPLSRINEF